MFNRILFCCLILQSVSSACIKRTLVQKALPRGELDSKAHTTCSVLLPHNEYKGLAAQLTPTDPLFVVTTNDLHGHTDARDYTLQISEREKYQVSVGGLERMASYLAALCRAAKTRLIYLDAGDSYQGTAISNSSSGVAVIDSFSSLGLMASTFGNHEFDFGQDRIKTWLNVPQRNFWYVTSSMTMEIEGKKIPWSEVGASRFGRSVVLDISGIKVGLAGYTTDSTAIKSIPDNVKNLNFGELSSVLLNESEPLRKNGAEITILLSHAGGSCDMRLPPTEGDSACKDSEYDELGRTLRKHPEAAKQWNLIVAGHTHAAQRHIISGVPIIQTTGLGLSLGLAKIHSAGVNSNTTLLNPVYICAEHFENWSGCHPQEWKWQNGKITSLGKTVTPSVAGRTVNIQDGERVKNVLAPWRSKIKDMMDKPITSLPTMLVHDRTQFSPASACLVDAWLNGLKKLKEVWGEYSSGKIDAAFLNAGALRSGLTAGSLTLGKLFEVIPYDNTAHIIALTSSELLRFAKVHESSPHDYLLASEGWSVIRKSNEHPSPRTLNVINTLEKKDSQHRWLIAISTFSKSFLEQAGIKTPSIDSGISIRETIAESLEKKISELKSCENPATDRMQILPDDIGG